MIYVFVCRNCELSLETYVRYPALKCNICGNLMDRDYRAENANVNVENLRGR
jgi:transcription elongation factor Elf1